MQIINLQVNTTMLIYVRLLDILIPKFTTFLAINKLFMLNSPVCMTSRYLCTRNVLTTSQQISV